MFNWVLRNIIGGDTGKRELALFLLFIDLLLIGNLLAREWAGLKADIGMTVWQVFTAFAFAFIGGAYGFDWYSKQHRPKGDA